MYTAYTSNNFQLWKENGHYKEMFWPSGDTNLFFKHLATQTLTIAQMHLSIPEGPQTIRARPRIQGPSFI
jgi:hypothetical protein